MKTKFLKWTASAFVAIALVVSCTEKEEPIVPGDASIISFSVNGTNGQVDETSKSINLELAPGLDLTSQIVVISVSSGATVVPASESSVDFSAGPVSFTVTDQSGTVINTYSVTASSAPIRKIAFIGKAAENTDAGWDVGGSDYSYLDDKAAGAFFKELGESSDIIDTAYFSFRDVAEGTADLSVFHAIWIQYDGAWWGDQVAQFPDNANHCLIDETEIGYDVPCPDLAADFVVKVKGYLDNGGNIYLGKYAGSMIDELGVSDYQPNNAWGGVATDDWATDEAWGVSWTASIEDPLFANIATSTADCGDAFFILLESGNERINRSNQYNLDFGDWAPDGDTTPIEERLASFNQLVGGEVLMKNCGLNEMLMIRWAETSNRGAVIASLGGTYRWYVGDGVQNSTNMKELTKNTLLYLADLELE